LFKLYAFAQNSLHLWFFLEKNNSAQDLSSSLIPQAKKTEKTTQVLALLHHSEQHSRKKLFPQGNNSDFHPIIFFCHHAL